MNLDSQIFFIPHNRNQWVYKNIAEEPQKHFVYLVGQGRHLICAVGNLTGHAPRYQA